VRCQEFVESIRLIREFGHSRLSVAGAKPASRAVSAVKAAMPYQLPPSRSLGRSQQPVHGVLVVAEIAAAMVLLVSSALLIRTFVRLADQSPGFRPDGVLTMKGTAFFGQVLDKVRAIAGVDSAAISAGLPLVGLMPLLASVFRESPNPRWVAGRRFRSPA
jgi:hypothetical protein